MVYWSMFGLIIIISVNLDLHSSRIIKLISAISAWSLLFFLVATRYDSVDYYGYIHHFSIQSFEHFSFPLYNAHSGTTGNEFLYATLISTLKWLNLSHDYFFIIVAFISLFLKLSFLYKHAFIFGLSLILFTGLLIFKEFGQIRNALIIGISFWAVFAAHNKKPITFFTLASMASMVQIFGLVLFPLYFLINRISNVRTLAAMGCVSAIFALFGGIFEIIINLMQHLPEQLEGALSTYWSQKENLPLNTFNLFLAAFSIYSLYLYNKISRVYDLGRAFIVSFFYGLLIYTASADFVVVAGRTSELIIRPAIIILLPLLIYYCKNETKVASFIFIIIFSLAIFYSGVNSAAPYQNILFHR